MQEPVPRTWKLDLTTLAPDPSSSWESRMVEYPCVIPEGEHIRLYYCGNGFGSTGIGAATAERHRRY